MAEFDVLIQAKVSMVTYKEMLKYCQQHQISISQLMRAGIYLKLKRGGNIERNDNNKIRAKSNTCPKRVSTGNKGKCDKANRNSIK